MDAYHSGPDVVAIDEAVDRDNVVEGWAELKDGSRYWVGHTSQSAARGHGSSVLAIGGAGDHWAGDHWIATGDQARQLMAYRTPKGRTSWTLVDSLGPCRRPTGDAPSASVAPLQIIRARPGVDAMTGLIEHLKLGPCFMGSDALVVHPTGDHIDQAIDTSGVMEGFVDVQFTIGGRSRLLSVWVGSTVESAARGYGSTILGFGVGNPWIYVHGLGSQLDKVETPKGRYAWFLGATTRPTSC